LLYLSIASHSTIKCFAESKYHLEAFTFARFTISANFSFSQDVSCFTIILVELLFHDKFIFLPLFVFLISFFGETIVLTLKYIAYAFSAKKKRIYHNDISIIIISNFMKIVFSIGIFRSYV
jgi:hypothetical protein